MHKLRWGDPKYRYGDENIYDVDTDSDYSDSSSEHSGATEWEEAWDEAITTITEEMGCEEEELDDVLGSGWWEMLMMYLNEEIEKEELWDWIDKAKNGSSHEDLRAVIDRLRSTDEEMWERAQAVWDEAVQNL